MKELLFQGTIAELNKNEVVSVKIRYSHTFFLNNKKVSKRKLYAILSNNYNENSKIYVSLIIRKLPFFKGDFNYFCKFHKTIFESEIMTSKIYIKV